MPVRHRRLRCPGCFAGLFIVRATKLPWLATFGDVIEKGGEAKPQKDGKKAGSDSPLKVVVLVATLVIVLSFVALRSAIGF